MIITFKQDDDGYIVMNFSEPVKLDGYIPTGVISLTTTSDGQRIKGDFEHVTSLAVCTNLHEQCKESLETI